MISRYGIFCEVIKIGNFTKVGEKIGYSQSAISQSIKSLEKELGMLLIKRKKDGVILTKDGKQIFPYIHAIYNAEKSLYQKQTKMLSLDESIIRLGTFTSVSRNILPQLIKMFKKEYPKVEFILQQGEYTSIESWLKEGSIDIGFVNADIANGLKTNIIYKDEMLAVLPYHHPLSHKQQVTLEQLSKEPFILLDEGEYSLPLNSFHAQNLSPKIEYKVYDDYSILAMVKQGLGVSMMYKLVLKGLENNLKIVSIKEKPRRNIALAWVNYETLPLASQKFANFILKNIDTILIEKEPLLHG